MQNKHIVILHKNEDRNIFMNKLKYPKTVYHVGDNPEEGDIHVDPKNGMQTCFAMWVIDNYDNLPDYTILSQAEPSDHVHEPLLAFDATLTGRWGSFGYARSIYDQNSFSWTRINPIRTVAHELGYGFHNDNNYFKFLYYFAPGEILFFHRDTLLEKPKSFYQKIIDIDLNNKFDEYISQPLPFFSSKSIKQFHPELNNQTFKNKLKVMTYHEKRPHSYIGFSYEALWFVLMSDQKLFKRLEKSQACLGNKLYFNLNNSKYDPFFKFEIFPYSEDERITKLQFKLLENDWFDWNCPKYLRWRKTLIEKTIFEGERFGFDGKKLLEIYKQIGYKHISL